VGSILTKDKKIMSKLNKKVFVMKEVLNPFSSGNHRVLLSFSLFLTLSNNPVTKEGFFGAIA
jgi:hypothetical protein